MNRFLKVYLFYDSIYQLLHAFMIKDQYSGKKNTHIIQRTKPSAFTGRLLINYLHSCRLNHIMLAFMRVMDFM